MTEKWLACHRIHLLSNRPNIPPADGAMQGLDVERRSTQAPQSARTMGPWSRRQIERIWLRRSQRLHMPSKLQGRNWLGAISSESLCTTSCATVLSSRVNALRVVMRVCASRRKKKGQIARPATARTCVTRVCFFFFPLEVFVTGGSVGGGGVSWASRSHSLITRTLGTHARMDG